MANSLSALNPTYWKPIVQDYLNNMLIAKDICNVKCEEYLSDGATVDFPYVNDVKVQSYTQGTDLTPDTLTATSSQLTVNQSKAVIFQMSYMQERQAKADIAMKLAYQSAYQLKNNIDQYVIATGIAGVGQTLVGGSLSTSTILGKLNDAYAALVRENATDGEMFAVIDADRLSLLTQTFVANGYSEADRSLRNQFAGRAAGFDVFVSNNLPSSQTLTMATNPTAGDTFTVAGVTFTFRAVPAVAGEIDIGNAAADTQLLVEMAINGTGTPSATTYIEVSAENRARLQSMQVDCGTFGSDAAVITSYGKIGGTETFTAAGNVFGTETSSMLFGRKGAISMAIQQQPELIVAQLEAQPAKNYMTHTFFGSKVFARDARRLVKMTFNV